MMIIVICESPPAPSITTTELSQVVLAQLLVAPPIRRFTRSSRLRNKFGCVVASIKNPKRDFNINYTDIRDHNEFDVRIEIGATDDDDDQNIDVPILFAVNPCANISGLVPMWWIPKVDEDHDDSSCATVVPSRIPVQISKNCITPSIISVPTT